MQITNCHVHTFTHRHTPSRFVPWPVGALVGIDAVRHSLVWVLQHVDPKRRTQLARYAQIVEVSFKKSQADVFRIVHGFYPEGTRFVILPMDMTFMGAGSLELSIDQQHCELAELRNAYPDQVIPFAAADPRHEGIVESTIRLIEDDGFRGIKLYPQLGYHPNDPALRPLYAYAERHGIPVLAHCSRRGVEYRGEVTERMRTDPINGERLDLDRAGLLSLFLDPQSYVPILQAYPKLRICLAHFGGDEEWTKYVDDPSDAARAGNWAAKILDLLSSRAYPNLWTDISYTIFADDDFLSLLEVFLADEHVRARVMYGSDFYVVDNAELEERPRALRVRAALGEGLFGTIAHDNPAEFLGEAPSQLS
jgi:predicted TIM-barrel fold metal-dependent hydrolase